MFFGIPLLRKQCSPCLLRGYLAYIFSGLLTNMQYVKRVCGKLVFRIEFSCVPRGNKGLGNLLNVNFVRKKIDSPREQHTSFPSVTLECCCLPGKLQKQGKFIASFVYKIDEIPASFSNLGDWREAKTRACSLHFSALKHLGAETVLRCADWKSSSIPTYANEYAVSV